MSSVANQNKKPRRIVVGVDGSTSSRSALAWAARQAELTSSPLAALSTWKRSASLDRSGVMPKLENNETGVKEMLESTVAAVLGASPSIELTLSVIEGHPSQVLVDESKNAELLVVGSRGHGEFVGMLLGSVGQFVAGHAHCPVVIVRDENGGDKN